MLVLTQLSVGAFVVGLILDQFVWGEAAQSLRPLQATNALIFGLLALGASVLHLGRPLYAFRAVLGLGHSWLSREIVAFGAFAKLATAYALGIWWLERASPWQATLIDGLGWSVAVTGLLAVFCSAMIYVCTQRECWSMWRVGLRFGLSAALTGTALVWLSILLLMVVNPSHELRTLVGELAPWLCGTLIAVAVVKLTWETALFRHLLSKHMTAMKRSAILASRNLSSLTFARLGTGLLGGVLGPVWLWHNASTAVASDRTLHVIVLSALVFIGCVVGELLERASFFAACAAPRMPGGIR
jgi:DMSO reductase anchor subunit